MLVNLYTLVLHTFTYCKTSRLTAMLVSKNQMNGKRLRVIPKHIEYIISIYVDQFL